MAVIKNFIWQNKTDSQQEMIIEMWYQLQFHKIIVDILWIYVNLSMGLFLNHTSTSAIKMINIVNSRTDLGSGDFRSFNSSSENSFQLFVFKSEKNQFFSRPQEKNHFFSRPTRWSIKRSNYEWQGSSSFFGKNIYFQVIVWIVKLIREYTD